MAELNWKPVEEQTRMYMFPNGKMTIAGVINIAITENTHRLETKDGRKFIVPSGWLAIELVMDSWSF